MQKYMPFNDDIKKNPDRKYIAGAYSTWDMELSQLLKEPKTSLTKLYKTANSKVSVAKAKEFDDYVFSVFKDEINRSAKLMALGRNFKSLDIDKKVFLAQDIVDNVTIVINQVKKSEIPNLIIKNTTEIKAAAMGFFDKIIYMNLMNKDYFEDREDFITVLMHEYVHAIDFFAPQISPLGAQVSHLSRQYDVSQRPRLHVLNPMEINAYGGYYKFGHRQK
ncbi:MAG: hypothetical protein LBF37_03790 [Rickettsiales bacterium]|jgi:hypothetical protein|nr:hypothetical protein [Rickettsiales bacterium]